MRKDRTKLSTFSRVVLSFIFLVIFSGITIFAEEDIDREFEFANGLVELGFNDYASRVADDIIRKYPNEKDRAQLIVAQVMISRRKFNEAEEIVRSMPADNPKAQAISLALASAYHISGEHDRAKVLYDEFFKQYSGRIPTDPDLLRFYQEASFGYSKMLDESGDWDGAAAALQRVLSTKPPKHAIRKLQVKLANLYVKQAKTQNGAAKNKLLGKAGELCRKVQWGGLDGPFGKAIVVLANIELAHGSQDKARELLDSNIELLKEIDLALKKRGDRDESPLAGARFMLGELSEELGNKLLKYPDKQDEAIKHFSKALGEFYNVFVKYGTSDWGAEAGLRAKSIKQQLEEMGKTVNIDLGAQVGNAIKTQARLADNLFQRGKYAEAEREYIKLLNEHPESESTPALLGNLVRCYANLDDKLYVKVICEYLGERFGDKEEAAKGLLLVAKWYFDKADTDMYLYIYDVYVSYFPDHPQAPAILYTMAGLLRKAGKNEQAATYFKRLIDNYPDSKYYLKALKLIAWDYYTAEKFEKAAEEFKNYVKIGTPGFDKAQAQFCMADSYRQLGELRKSLAAYIKLRGWVKEADSPYNAVAEHRLKNADLHEKTLFYIGYILARIKQPEKAISGYRKKAVKTIKQFIAQFPESKLAPQALSMLGSVQLEIGEFDMAVSQFEKLARDYPNSAEGKSALFSLIRAAIEVDKLDVAKNSLQKMLRNADAYSMEEFANVGQLMLDSGLHQETITAFQKVVDQSDERRLLERALYGMGRAHYEMQNYEPATKQLIELMERYPKSGLFYDARFIIGNAFREIGKLDQAIEAMKDVFEYADDDLLINRANYILGQIQRDQGNKNNALGSFQRVALLADPSDKELLPIIEKCILETLELTMELELYVDTQDSCDQYLQLFPESDKIEEIRELRADAKLKASDKMIREADPKGVGEK